MLIMFGSILIPRLLHTAGNYWILTFYYFANAASACALLLIPDVEIAELWLFSNEILLHVSAEKKPTSPTKVSPGSYTDPFERSEC